MNQWLLKWYVKSKLQRELLKTEHYCEDCHKSGLVVRRISVLYLILYVLAGILAGWLIVWWMGFVVTFLCTYINIRKSKPQCRYCFSTNVRIADAKTEPESLGE